MAKIVTLANGRKIGVSNLTAYDREILSALYKVEGYFKENGHHGQDVIQDAIKMIEANA